jgi:hypothetical protein
VTRNWYLYDDEGGRLDVDLVTNEYDDALVCSLTVEDDSNVASIHLNPGRVRDLRLALQAVERRFR